LREKSLRNVANGGFCGPEAAQPGTPGPLALEWMQERLPAETTGDILVRSREAKWKFRIIGITATGIIRNQSDELGGARMQVKSFETGLRAV
jgi:hypothetical protein